MLLSDWEIRALCIEKEYRDLYRCAPFIHGMEDNGFRPLLEPFAENTSGNGIVSYGLTHAGYDLRMDKEIWVNKPTYGEIIEPRRMKEEGYSDRLYDKIITDPDKGFIVPPHSYILGKAYEYMRFPRHLKGRVVGKSTLARCGVLINCTPMEPGWHGYLVIEVANISPSPIRLYAMQGIAQLEIEGLSKEPETDYNDKGGIYQNQTGVTPARVKE